MACKIKSLKTESLLISRKSNTVHHSVFMRDQQIKDDVSHKRLGVILTNDCSWQTLIHYIKEKTWTRVNIMHRLKSDLNRKPLLEYADAILV